MSTEPLDLDAARAQIDHAHKMVGSLAAGVRFRMSIPAQPERDSDLVLSAGLAAGEAAIAEVERYRATSERFTDPSVTEAIAREIESVRPVGGCLRCVRAVRTCPHHIAEHLVAAMRAERLVVLTAATADDIIRNVEGVEK